MRRGLAIVWLAVVVIGLATGSTAPDARDELQRFSLAFDDRRAPGAEFGSPSDRRRYTKLFRTVYERIQKSYVDAIDPHELIDDALIGLGKVEAPLTDERLMEGALQHMVHALDPHSSYLNQQRFKDMQAVTRGEFGGLGIRVMMEEGLVKVVSPIDDTPAARAGLKANDLISHLDGVTVKGMSLAEAVQNMRGPVKTRIVLTVLRDDRAPFDVAIVRDIIRIRPVKSRREGSIAYIRITTFNEQTEDALDDAMARLRDDIGPAMRGVVLDLRNNPGGLLPQSVAVADAFLERGDIVSTRGRKGRKSQKYDARRGRIADGLPMVVLINGGSASASEIVAGALQDLHRATVIGTRSFGKGSVQTIFSLPEQRALRLTTSRYFTPTGRSIQARGIEPDIVVVKPGKQAELEARRRREADLPGALDTDPVEVAAEDRQPSPKAAAADREGGDAAAKAPDKPATPEEDDDFQLRWALAFLRATGSLDFDVMDASYVALQPIEVFERPSRDALPVDSLFRGAAIKVVGRIRGRNWFLVDRGEARLAYVRAAHLAPTASVQ